MTESSDTFDVTLSPSRLLYAPAHWVAVLLAGLAVFLPALWAVSIFVSGLPEPAGIGLMLIVSLALMILLGYTYKHVHKRRLANKMRTLRVSPARIEYFGRGQEILRCDRASLRVRRLCYVPRVWGEVEVPPDAMAIELSGPLRIPSYE